MTDLDEPDRIRLAARRSRFQFSISTILKLTVYTAVALPMAIKLTSATTADLWFVAIIMLLFSPLIFAAEIIDWVLGSSRRK